MSSPPPVTTTPGSNVTPMWGGTWPGRPPAVPPGCFSQLYGLNQCYDDIIMMKQILAKVICDMASTDPAFQQCLVDAIAKSGSNVPLIGVTNGTDAQPGQVGEFMQFSVQFTIGTALGTQPVNGGVLPPGDWDLFAVAEPTTYTDILAYSMSPTPAGFVNGLGGAFFGAGTEQGVVVVSQAGRALISTPTLMVFNVVSQAPTSQQGSLIITARRAR